jgi:hypothetical protein
MYYAHMYCYGMDNNHVGITGIRGCLGAVFATANRLFAVHIPPGDPARELAGANAFTGMITATAGANPAGELALFVNGMNRNDVDDEARTMRNALGGPPTRVYRIMRNLGAQSGGLGADSAVIKVQRMMGGGLSMAYKHIEDNQMQAGGGAKTGIYVPMYNGTFGNPVRPSPAELFAAWFPVDTTNCHVRGIH